MVPHECSEWRLALFRSPLVTVPTTSPVRPMGYKPYHGGHMRGTWVCLPGIFTLVAPRSSASELAFLCDAPHAYSHGGHSSLSAAC